MPSFKMQSLQEVCLDRVSRLLKKETWNRCARNPFSSMPTKTIDTLMAFLLSRPNFTSTRDKRLLFQSGQLSRLELSSILVDEERELLSKWMTKETCTGLRVLSVLFPLCDLEGKYVVRDILQRCHHLEDFHSKLVLDLDDLKNCHRLKNLRLHLPNPPHNVVSEEFLQTIIDFVQSKPNLEVFSFCNIKDDTKIAYKAIAASLENCPKLISVGYIDSLEALLHIRRTRESTSKLNLKRCLWGVNKGDDIQEPSDYRRKYLGMVQNAVHMCPTVETLVINVYQEQALEHLVHLKHLRSLSLKFIYNAADNVTTLVFLLRRIGFLLDHLSLDMGDGDQAIPVEVIRDHCFNLKTLQIYGAVAMEDGMENCLFPLQIQRLYLWKADAQSLFLLLRNSPKLTELYLGIAICLDEGLVDKILMDNFVFPNLIVVGIKSCLMTATAMRKLVQSAFNLKELFFGSITLYRDAHRTITEYKTDVLHYYDNFKLFKREYYTFRPDPCRF